MTRLRLGLVVWAWVLAAGMVSAANPTLGTASGVVKKVTASVLIIHPRGPDGRFQNALALKVRGPNKIAMLTTQVRAGKTVAVQQDTPPGNLQPNQAIAVIYTIVEDEAVLLAAVVQPIRPSP